MAYKSLSRKRSSGLIRIEKSEPKPETIIEPEIIPEEPEVIKKPRTKKGPK